MEITRTKIADLSKKQRTFLNITRELASLSTYGNYKHGAVLVKGGRILSSSCNKNRFNAFGLRFRLRDTGYSTYHAELGCVFGVSRETTEDATIYVTRVGKSGEFRMSKPCPMCEAVMRHCGIRKVVYTIDPETVESYRL